MTYVIDTEEYILPYNINEIFLSQGAAGNSFEYDAWWNHSVI